MSTALDIVSIIDDTPLSFLTLVPITRTGKGVIGLPAKFFCGTGIPACIVVIDKENAVGRRGIFMIDASKARDINALGVYWKVFPGLLKRPAEFARRRRTNSGVLPGNAETLPKKKPRATRPSRVLLRV